MPAEIADFVSAEFYGGRLRTPPGDRREHGDALFRSVLAFVDTSARDPAERRERSGRSRERWEQQGYDNPLEAQLLASMAVYYDGNAMVHHRIGYPDTKVTKGSQSPRTYTYILTVSLHAADVRARDRLRAEDSRALVRCGDRLAGGHQDRARQPAQPEFARMALESWLPAAGIRYRWEKHLGGFRRPGPGNPDVTWREDMFRGFAEHMRSADFRAALDAVLAEAGSVPLAVMRSESLWWRCHRRLLADFAAVAQGTEVRHLMHDGRAEPHRTSDGLRLRDDGLLVYDAGQPTLL